MRCFRGIRLRPGCSETHLSLKHASGVMPGVHTTVGTRLFHVPNLKTMQARVMTKLGTQVGADFFMTGRPFTPNDENWPLAPPPKHRATNVREWPICSVRKGPLFDIRGSVLAVISSTSAAESASAISEQPRSVVGQSSVCRPASAGLSGEICGAEAPRRLKSAPPRCGHSHPLGWSGGSSRFPRGGAAVHVKVNHAG